MTSKISTEILTWVVAVGSHSLVRVWRKTGYFSTAYNAKRDYAQRAQVLEQRIVCRTSYRYSSLSQSTTALYGKQCAFINGITEAAVARTFRLRSIGLRLFFVFLPRGIVAFFFCFFKIVRAQICGSLSIEITLRYRRSNATPFLFFSSEVYFLPRNEGGF